ncbi:MAG: hypothetical protein ACRYFA_10820 [Janthinobacterium lividum]
MNLSSNQIKATFVFIIGSIIISVIYYNLRTELKNIVNFFTLYGTFASLFGLWLAYLQIQSIKETSEETKKAVESSLLRINKVLSISEISKASKVIQEIQTSILNDKSELALIRMKDLKQILIQVKFNGDLVEYTSHESYNQHITDLSIDINNINDLLLGKKLGVNFSKINQNLENLITVLIEFENKLKFERHD